MADRIKYAAKFSEDAISIALNSLTKEEFENFERGLIVLTRNLGEKKEKKVTAERKKTFR